MGTRRRTETPEAYVSPGKHIALIARITIDKTGRVQGVKNQILWGQAYCAQQWPDVPVVVYADNNKTAADKDVWRPGYERYREAVRQGDVVGIWAVETERIERVPSRWFTMAEDLEAIGITHIHTKDSGVVEVDTVTAGILAVVAMGEVKKIKKRGKRRLDQNAAEGRPAGVRPFGYRHGETDQGVKTYVIVEEQAAIIRESAERFLTGWSFGHIADDLNARGIAGPHRVKVKDAAGEVVTLDGRSIEDGGVPVTRPSKLATQSIKSWLTSLAVAGRRVHRGIDVGVGNWPAILDADTFAAISDRIKAPHLVNRSDGKGTYPVNAKPKVVARRYLLTGGIAYCGVCSARLTAQAVQRDHARGISIPTYMCSKARGGRGCVAIKAEETEAFVVAELLARLQKPAFLDALGSDDYADLRTQVTTRLRAIDGRRNDLARQWARGEKSQAEWDAARVVLVETEREARVELARIPVPAARIDPAQIIEDWASPAATLDERRDVVRMLIDSVTINPRAHRGANRFDTGRIAIAWRSKQADA